MYAHATERRLAGDPRGACAAAHIDVDIDPSHIDGPLADDLAHLVPDLLRWHFPREGADGLLRPGVVARLTDYGLTVCSPTRHEHPQRLLLRLAPEPRPAFGRRPRATTVERWEHLRHLWDARHTADLRQRVGGGERCPFFRRDGTPAVLPTRRPADGDPAALTEWTTLLHEAGEVGRAWRDAGFEVADLGDPDATGDPRVAFTTVAADARRLGGRVVLDAPHRPVAFAVDADADPPVVRVADAPHALPSLPRISWERPHDLDLLRTGALRPEALHPLVRAALFPDLALGDTYEPPPPDAPPMPLTVRVRCAGAWHPATIADNTVHLPAHSPAEIARERTVGALGGTPNGCAAAPHRWRTHPPRPVRRLRRHAILAALHGDGPALVGLLDAGLDPTLVRTRDGRTLVHLLAGVDPAHAPALAQRLVAAGEDPNAADRTGATPLPFVVRDGGPVATVRALLDAGADPTATLGAARRTALHVVRGSQAEATVRLLVAAGLSVEARDRFGETPLVRAVDTGVVPAVRALLRAGADRTVPDRFGRSLITVAEERDDAETVALLDGDELP
jgi:hypothetical protein